MIFILIYVTIDLAVSYALVAELADAPDLGSGGKPWEFKSLRAHQKEELLQISDSSFFDNQGIISFNFIDLHTKMMYNYTEYKNTMG